jgi:protein TonB
MENEHVGLAATSSADQGRNASDDPADHLLEPNFEETPLWTALFDSLRDTLFPLPLPPLELTSTPIPMPNRMASRTNPWAIGTAAIANAGLLILVILLGLRSTIGHLPSSLPGTDIHLKDFTLFVPPSLLRARGGGGGGAHEVTDPIKGRLPRREETPIVPPQVSVLQHPMIAIDSSIAVPLDIKLPDNPSLPNIGVHNSPNVKLDSNGRGSQSGIGTGSNGGDGPGSGPGLGPGADHGFGGSVYMPGVGGVSKPVLLVSSEAEFSDEARRQKYQGVCVISIIVDERGYPKNLRVTRSLGLGLDEKALEAVQKYRFKPSLKDGKPVASYVTVEVNFHLY